MYPTIDYYEFNIEPLIDYENLTGLDCLVTNLPLSNTYLPTLYFLIFFAGVSGNVFVIMVMCTKRGGGGRLVDTFVLNLAVADLMFVFTLPLWAVSALQDHSWVFGDGLCKISSYVIAVNCFSNIFFLACMSVDRYLAVVRMLDSRFLRTPGRVRLTCGGVWALSLALGAPSLLFRRVVESKDGVGFCVEDSESLAFQGVSLVSSFLAFVLPVLVIVFCYGSILARLRAGQGKAQIEARRRRRRSHKIVFAIVTAFILSWTPFNIFKTVLIGSRIQGVVLSCSAESLLAKGLILSTCLAFCNSCANPGIYLFLDQHFQNRAHELCHGCLGQRGPRRGAASSSSLSFGTSDGCSGSGTTRSCVVSTTQID